MVANYEIGKENDISQESQKNSELYFRHQKYII